MPAKASMYCLSNVAISGVSRSDFAIQQVVCTIAGVDQSARVMKGTTQISETWISQPNTATITVWGLIPTAGQQVIIASGDIQNRKFGGVATKVTQLSNKQAQGVLAVKQTRLDCTDWSYLLDKSIVEASLPQQSSSDMILYVFANFLTTAIADGFTWHHVPKDGSGPVIGPQVFNALPASQALDQIAEAAGWEWGYDVWQDIHYYAATDGSLSQPIAITPSNLWYEQFAYTVDLSQVRTRAIVYGATTTCPIAMPANPTAGLTIPSIPIVDSSAFLSTGGSALVNGQVVSYTATDTPVTSGNTTGTVTCQDVQIGQSSVAIVDTAWVFSTGTSWCSIGDQVVVFSGVNSLGTVEVLSSLTSVGGVATATLNNHGFVVGQSVQILGATPSDYNGVYLIASIVDSNNFTYAGTFASSPATGTISVAFGQLSGIPASGFGSFQALVKAGATVQPLGELYNPVGITEAATAGATVSVRVQVDDGAAQVALAAMEGGSGVHAVPVTVSGATAAQCLAAGNIALSIESAPNLAGTVTSYDPSMRAGRVLPINMPLQGINTSVVVQRATIHPISPAKWRCEATFATVFRDLNRVLQQIANLPTVPLSGGQP